MGGVITSAPRVLGTDRGLFRGLHINSTDALLNGMSTAKDGSNGVQFKAAHLKEQRCPFVCGKTIPPTGFRRLQEPISCRDITLDITKRDGVH